jgi:predicted RNA-binding Zn-ribbon protein involved in translation (DUF1610 family)
MRYPPEREIRGLSDRGGIGMFFKKKPKPSPQSTGTAHMEEEHGELVFVFGCPHCGREIRHRIASGRVAVCTCGANIHLGKPPGVD